MYILALFCLLAVGSQASPIQPLVEPAQHIVIVTPQAQVHLEPALRYVHGLSPIARTVGPHHHEETIVYVPAGAAVAETVSSGRAGLPYYAAEPKQSEISQTISAAQEQATTIIQSVSEQAAQAAGAAASAAAATGAGFFPALFPTSKDDLQKLKTEKIELIETPANTQPLLATEARHFYSLPQVYHHHPVVDVVHTPVYTWPISAIRARSIQTDDIPIQAIEQKPQSSAAPPASLADILPEELPKAQPLLKEQKQPELIVEKVYESIYPAAPLANEENLAIAARQLEESNTIQTTKPSAEIILIKEAIKEEAKLQEQQLEKLQERQLQQPQEIQQVQQEIEKQQGIQQERLLEKQQEIQQEKQHEKQIEQQQEKQQELQQERKLEKQQEKQQEVQPERQQERQLEPQSEKQIEPQQEKKIELQQEKLLEKQPEKLLEKPQEKQQERLQERQLEPQAEKQIEQQQDKQIVLQQEKLLEKPQEKLLEKPQDKLLEKPQERQLENQQEKQTEPQSQEKRIELLPEPEQKQQQQQQQQIIKTLPIAAIPEEPKAPEIAPGAGIKQAPEA